MEKCKTSAKLKEAEMLDKAMTLAKLGMHETVEMTCEQYGSFFQVVGSGYVQIIHCSVKTHYFNVGE